MDHSAAADAVHPGPVRRTSLTGSPTTSLDASARSQGTHGTVDPDVRSFPLVLHALVSDPSSDAAVHWLPCGTRFVIADKDDFSSEWLPRYFGTRGGGNTKFTSFTRRLKRWKFERVPSGREMGAYYHELFLRGHPELAKTILYPLKGGAAVAATATGGGKVAKKPPAVPRAQRRASTGSIMPHALAAARELDLEELAADLSPMPLKGPVGIDEGDILPMPFMQEDIIDALDGLGEPSPHVTPSLSAQTASTVVSNASSFLLPPPALSSDVGWGGAQDMGGVSGMAAPSLMRPGYMRRHSTTMDNVNAATLAMMANANGWLNNPQPSQLMGTNFGSNQGMAVSATVGSGDLSGSNPLSQMEDAATEEDTKDLFNLSKEFSFDDLKALSPLIDPFT